MMIVRSMISSDMLRIHPQPSQEKEFSRESRQTWSVAFGRLVEPTSFCACGMDVPVAIACFSVVADAPRQAVVWSILSSDAGRRMVSLTRAANAWLDRQPFDRIVMLTARDDVSAQRWATMLGFNPDPCPVAAAPNSIRYERLA